MGKKAIDLKLTAGFSYSVKNGEMNLNFFCDCCHNEVVVIGPLCEGQETLETQECFDLLKEDMQDKFHRCEQCNLLICQECWDTRESRCEECEICVTTP